LGFFTSCNFWAQLTLLISTALTLYTFFNFLWIFVAYSSSAWHGSVDWGTVLQAGRSWVWFPVGSLGFFIGLILVATLWPWGQLNLWQKWIPGVSLGGWRQPMPKVDHLATFMWWLSRNSESLNINES
jgi:hypothetical protein